MLSDCAGNASVRHMLLLNHGCGTVPDPIYAQGWSFE